MGHRAGDNLTDKRILFCHNYLKYKCNGTKAVIKSGYSKKGAAQKAAELLTIVNVKKYIENLVKKQLSQIDKMTLEWLQDVSKIQGSDIRNIMKWSEKGIRVKPSKELEDDHAYPISEISEHINSKGQRTIRVKLESKTKALELKGKYLSLLGDNNQPEPSKKEKQTKEERIERLSRIKELLKKQDE